MGPSSPYYLFGAQRRYPYAWHGNAGGVPQGYRAAETRGLSNADMIESGYEPGTIPYVAFNHSVLHRELPDPISDWPLVRPAGKEPLDPNNDGLGFWDGLSDNEKRLVLFGGAVAGAWVLWRHTKRRRRNPPRRRARRRARRPQSSRARRLAKLRALARSGNVHEAALARQRAREISRKGRRRR
jgi:hypothetical protein